MVSPDRLEPLRYTMAFIVAGVVTAAIGHLRAARTRGTYLTAKNLHFSWAGYPNRYSPTMNLQHLKVDHLTNANLLIQFARQHEHEKTSVCEYRS
jgi:hypothetical protein